MTQLGLTTNTNTGKRRTAAQKRTLSKAMKRHWAQRKAANGHAHTVVLDNMDVVPAAAAHLHRTPTLHTHSAEAVRFPFAQYQETTNDLRRIIADRDNSGRNSYLAFWDGFPHGLSDLTFEMHRRVARVLGVEKELSNGVTGLQRDALVQVMRNDLADLANYAIFGVMKVDADAKE